MVGEKDNKNTGSETSKHTIPELKLLGSHTSRLTLSKYCVDTRSTLKDIGPPVIHLINIKKLKTSGSKTLNVCFVGTNIFRVTNQ